MHTPLNDALSNDNGTNDLVTLTFTFMLKIAFWDFVVTRGIVFRKFLHILFDDAVMPTL